jgi:stage V sporulation protein G
VDITEIRITLRDDEKLKAFASITLDGMLVIRGLKIIEGANGTFVAMPSRRRKDGSFQDVAHPINRETREWLEGAVITAYKEERNRTAAGSYEGSRDTDEDRGDHGEFAAEDAY